MKILFDTNIVLDALLERRPFALNAVHLIRAAELGQLHGYIGATSFTTIYYLATKHRGPAFARECVQRLLRVFDVVPVNGLVLQAALTSQVPDYEDAILVEAGFHIGVEGIVTRDVDLLKSAPIRIYTSENLLAWLAREQTNE
jgi:predicted nucleic acid-binding protein